ncbi:MAG: hypothetical protein EBQ96_10030 [Proteobacteria bacterium]|nr:hypothetical protein [Pseudomonadota bacterium]
MRKLRWFVTKSRSGHYTLTLKAQVECGGWELIGKSVKLGELSRIDGEKAYLLEVYAEQLN